MNRASQIGTSRVEVPIPQLRSSRTRSDAFRSMLSDETAAAVAPSSTDSSPQASRQNSVAISVVGQKTVAGAVPSSETDAHTPAGANAAASPSSNSPTEAPAAPMSALDRLSEALRAANIDPTGLNLKSYEQRVFCPGGDYTNKGIEVKCGNNTEYLSADLVALYPEIAIADIKRSLAFSKTA